MAKSRPAVFISYASSEASFARELAEHLRAAGVDAASPMTDVLPGENFSAQSADALHRAGAIVVLVTPAAMKSAAVRHEIQFALGEERFEDRLIPVMVKETSSDTIPWVLNRVQWTKGWDVKKISERIVRTLNGPKRRTARA